MTASRRSTRLAKVTGIYRWSDGARFDHDYYHSEHARLTTELLAPLGLLRFESDRTVGAPGLQPGTVVACSNAYFASLGEAQAALSRAGAALAADLPKYTNIRPVLHLSEVLVHEP